MAVITRGEALGHDMWIDRSMLSQVADAINAGQVGVKSRFTHPGLSADGMGKHLGRVRNASVDGDVVRGDLHFSEAAHQSPDGNLAAYVLKLATTDPAAFGASIAFEHDSEMEKAFHFANGGDDGFTSPDPNNLQNYPHARLKELRAVDAVDEPAANPTGLFSRGSELVIEADALLSYGLGLTKTRPKIGQLDIDPDRAAGFLARFLDLHDLALVPKGKTMPRPKQLDETAPETDKPADDEEEIEDEVTDEELPTPETDKPKETAAGHGEGAKFLKAFGDKGGVWFAQGKSFAEAQDLYVADLKAANEKLSKANADLMKHVTLLKGESRPVTFQAAEPDKTPQQKASVRSGLGGGLAKFAASIRIPGAPQPSNN